MTVLLEEAVGLPTLESTLASTRSPREASGEDELSKRLELLSKREDATASRVYYAARSAVVHISAVESLRAAARRGFRKLWPPFPYGPESPDDEQDELEQERGGPELEDGYSGTPRSTPNERSEEEWTLRGTGTGFCFDTELHIVTNAHVVAGASRYWVRFITGDQVPARVLGLDTEHDVAVLQLHWETSRSEGNAQPRASSMRLSPSGRMTSSTTAGAREPPDTDKSVRERLKRTIEPLRFGNSTKLLVGQRVFAVGNPFSLEHTLTAGILSGVGREVASRRAGGIPMFGLLQTDAALNAGNSGGPLLDTDGCVIGMNCAIASPSGAFAGVGFAIPIHTVRRIVEEILTRGRASRPGLGVTFAPTALTRRLGISQGVLILTILPDGPAARAGLRATERRERLVLGDVVLAIDDQPVNDTIDVLRILQQKSVGDLVKLPVASGQEILAKQHDAKATAPVDKPWYSIPEGSDETRSNALSTRQVTIRLADIPRRPWRIPSKL
ncbi:hypothetical protein F1559_003226 [Cyanidiococcus yangmingshanensis]|uniref:PDZ domain-containing protein n=1 Tax=Cyanidiococcus yangmingshanensis TaxID=2690220 RepID=A0A7J7ILM7_9RHOD|nr:hypothetical protein F1559_003226 [Cyanidiococcus yangmingshanensis]